MKLQVKLLMLSVTMAWPLVSLAQLNNVLDPYIHDSRIGLVDEFFARFNGAEAHPNIQMDKNDGRKGNMMMLFDLAQFNSKSDSRFVDASKMMDVAIRESVSLNYSDTTWAALAHCKGRLNKKEVAFDLYLTVENRREDLYKWVISRVEGGLFETTPKNTNDMIMLYPDDHETSFMSLHRMTDEQPYNVARFLRKDFKYDCLSAFTFLVHNKQLSIDYVEKLEFVFTQIPGYMFNVGYVNRVTGNAGWLITDFRKVSDEEKRCFLNGLRQEVVIVPSNKCNEKDDKICWEVNEKKRQETIDSLKNNMARRTKEKIGQLNNYINLMQSREKTKEHKADFLSQEMMKLFAGGTIVRIVDEYSVTLELMDFKAFLSKIKPDKKRLYEVKAVSIPIWNDTIAELGDSVTYFDLPANMFIVKNNTILGVDPTSSVKGQVLPIRREETEMGVEWIPLFGDLTIVLKSKRSKK